MWTVHRNGHEIKVNSIECADERFVAFWDLFEQGWETSTIDTLDKYLTPDTTYIDLGAWIGPTVLYAAPLCKQCYAFEPDPLAYRQLKANVELNGFTNVTTFNEAVLDYNGTAAFGNDNLCNSMSRIEHPNKMFSAPCRTLDSFAIEYPLTSPLFIKVDIEGAEELVFRSGFFKQYKPTVFVSLHVPWFQNEVEALKTIHAVGDLYRTHIPIDKGTNYLFTEA